MNPYIAKIEDMYFEDPKSRCAVSAEILIPLKDSGCTGWHPNPVMPRPRPNQKIINFMAPTLDQPDYIVPGQDRTKTVYHQPEINKFRINKLTTTSTSICPQ